MLWTGDEPLSSGRSPREILTEFTAERDALSRAHNANVDAALKSYRKKGKLGDDPCRNAFAIIDSRERRPTIK